MGYEDNYGYWTLSPYAGRSPYYAWYVGSGGQLYDYADVTDDGGYGVRPVITISKSVLE